MRLAKSSKTKIEEFFAFYLKDENFQLPQVSIYIGVFSAVLTQVLQIQGITIGRNIFIDPKLLYVNSDKNRALSGDLIVHEITHVLQYRNKGFWKFLIEYLGEYWRGLRKTGKFNAASRNLAYFEISFEKEAREAASNFLRRKIRHLQKPPDC